MKRLICLCFAAMLLIGNYACQGISIQIGPKEAEAPTATPYVKSQEEKNEEIYQEVKDLMKECRFSDAKKKLSSISKYKDAEKLLRDCETLVEAKKLYYTVVKSLKDILKNPASLQVHSLKFGPSDKDGWIEVSIEYSAQNGLGGMNRETYTTRRSPADKDFLDNLKYITDYWSYLKNIDVAEFNNPF